MAPTEAAPTAANMEPTDAAPSETLVFSPKAHRTLPDWLHEIWVDLVVFVVVHYNCYPLIAMSILLYMMMCGYAWVALALIVLYLPSFFNGAEKTPNGRHWDALRHAGIWVSVMERLRLTIVREAPLEQSKQYIFGYHPHGIIVMSRFALCGKVFEALFPGVSYRMLGASAVFRVPLAREICLWMGAVDASRSTATQVLESGMSIAVYPGGIREMFSVDPDSKENVLVLKKRYGFVKLAIRHGANLVPVFVFNEKHMYKVFNPPAGVSSFLQKVMPFPLVFFWGRFLWMPFNLPKDKPFGVVYGKPIEVTKNETPSDDEVQAVHTKYMAEVERVFHQYKGQFGYAEDEKLVLQ